MNSLQISSGSHLASAPRHSLKNSCNARWTRDKGGRQGPPRALKTKVEAPPQTQNTRSREHEDVNQLIREGHYEKPSVQAQASKRDSAQQSLASTLTPATPSSLYDVAVVGAGPAGMYLAAELSNRGLRTVIIGHDSPLVNNYGVWIDEARSLGLEHTLDNAWDDAVCYFKEGHKVNLGRGYGRVSRRKLREHLLRLCTDAGVEFLKGEVANMELTSDGKQTCLDVKNGPQMHARLVTLAAGAAAGKFLRYEEDAPGVAAQTAYGIEAEVENYDQVYPAGEMLFMDFRRHHTGVWDGAASRIKSGAHPAGDNNLWGTRGEVPSFRYAMPLGGNRVFLEETCLVAKPALPFKVLKRRLERRLKAMGVRVKEVHEEEWSYIPVGGPLPEGNQPITAFGAAANLVHPATGFSVSRSFREAPGLADQIAASLRKPDQSVQQTAAQVWEALWPQEKRTQTSFHVFGMELLASLDLADTNLFFETFFKLPKSMWQGYMASKLSSLQLISFAFLTFVLASPRIKMLLVASLLSDPAGAYVFNAYKKLYIKSQEEKELSEP
uniref:Lycopene epsilon-cyclase n=1 Tax=Dunaliella salina TaxID=3046 RepID=A0A8E2Z9P2_DUNSA|nr:lycopene epsilon-cyclase [Dunaliella salina]